MMSRSFLLLGLFLIAGEVSAEDRFYQIIDANGHVQTIRQGGSAVRPLAKMPTSGGIEAKQEELGQGVKDDVASTPLQNPAVTDASSPAYAPYDGGDYADSEALDANHKKSDRKRFYIINDAVGQRVEDMSADEVPEQVSVARLDTGLRPYTELKEIFVQRPLEDVTDLALGCLSEPQLKKVIALDTGSLADVLFDGKLMAYFKPGQLVQAYRIGGEGFRSVALRSYARKDGNAAFVMPLIAFADRKGCITRVIDGYFQRFYESTKSKHAMLEAGLILHVEDSYVLVVMPPGDGAKRGFSPEYRISSVGQVSIKWQK